MASTRLACIADLFVYLTLMGDLSALATDHPRRQTASQNLTATYNSTLGAPACLDLGSSCQTGDVTIAGVSNFEPNGPNTVDNCTDNSLAEQDEDDEYVQRIIVRAKDGGTMTAGSELQIHATVWKALDVSARAKPDAKETVHIYYASETFAGSYPVGVGPAHPHFGSARWKWICTRLFDVDGNSMEVASCDFAIPGGNFEGRPGGGIQAVRVNYGFGEYALEPCTETPLWGEPYSDVDDLVFRVAPAPASPGARPSESPSSLPSASPSSEGEGSDPPATSPVLPSSRTAAPADPPSIPTDVPTSVPTSVPSRAVDFDDGIPSDGALRGRCGVGWTAAAALALQLVIAAFLQ